MRKRKKDETPDLGGGIKTLMDESYRLGQTGEAVMNVAATLVHSAHALKRVLEVDKSPDLIPELQAALDAVNVAAEAVRSVASVVEQRYAIAIERALL